MNNELINNNEINNIFDNIKELVINSRNKVYTAVNTEMLNLYWNIGKIIMEIQQGDERATYGETVLEKLSEKLTNEFGKGFSKRNLERMRKFYIYFPIATTLSSQLSWSHYLELIKIEEEAKRNFYIKETIINANKFTIVLVFCLIVNCVNTVVDFKVKAYQNIKPQLTNPNK